MTRSVPLAGYTLFTPLLGSGMVYLVDMEGAPVHTWQLSNAPGAYAYLSDRETLFLQHSE
jgi:hypothetical protein